MSDQQKLIFYQAVKASKVEDVRDALQNANHDEKYHLLHDYVTGTSLDTTPLHAASKNGDYAMVKVLLDEAFTLENSDQLIMDMMTAGQGYFLNSGQGCSNQGPFLDDHPINNAKDEATLQILLKYLSDAAGSPDLISKLVGDRVARLIREASKGHWLADAPVGDIKPSTSTEEAVKVIRMKSLFQGEHEGSLAILLTRARMAIDKEHVGALKSFLGSSEVPKPLLTQALLRNTDQELGLVFATALKNTADFAIKKALTLAVVDAAKEAGGPDLVKKVLSLDIPPAIRQRGWFDAACLRQEGIIHVARFPNARQMVLQIAEDAAGKVFRQSLEVFPALLQEDPYFGLPDVEITSDEEIKNLVQKGEVSSFPVLASNGKTLWWTSDSQSAYSPDAAMIFAITKESNSDLALNMLDAWSPRLDVNMGLRQAGSYQPYMLHLAVSKKMVQLVKGLILHGARMDLLDQMHRSSLTLAVSTQPSNDIERQAVSDIVKALLAAGASPSAKDSQLAETNGMPEVARLMH